MIANVARINFFFIFEQMRPQRDVFPTVNLNTPFIPKDMHYSSFVLIGQIIVTLTKLEKLKFILEHF